MDEPRWLVRVIEVFSNQTEKLIASYVLPPISLRALQRVWERPDDDPMVDCFELLEAQVAYLSAFVEITWDFQISSYFLAAYTTDWEATQRAGGYLGLFPPPMTLPAFPDAVRVKPKPPLA